MPKADTAQSLRAAADLIEQRDDEDILGMKEVARMLGHDSVDTLRYWRYRKTGPRSFKMGRSVVYRRGAVRAWIAEQEAAGSD